MVLLDLCRAIALLLSLVVVQSHSLKNSLQQSSACFYQDSISTIERKRKPESGLELYRMFTDIGCTVHFSIRELQPWSSIHNNVLKFCQDSISFPGCILFQTDTRQTLNFTRGDDDEPEYPQLHRRLSSISYKLWLESGFENWEPVQFVLESQKFQSVCQVQLGTLTEVELNKRGLAMTYLPDPGYWQLTNQKFIKYTNYIIFQMEDIPWNRVRLAFPARVNSKVLITLKNGCVGLGHTACLPDDHLSVNVRSGALDLGSKQVSYLPKNSEYRYGMYAFPVQFIEIVEIHPSFLESAKDLDNLWYSIHFGGNKEPKLRGGLSYSGILGEDPADEMSVYPIFKRIILLLYVVSCSKFLLIKLFLVLSVHLLFPKFFFNSDTNFW